MYPDKHGRIMSPDEQLRLWVEGKPIHNGATSKDGECCPDFSCCLPDMLWPVELRKAFAAAEDEERSKLLFSSLSGLMDYTETRKAHIIA